ncbi:hypothetical protein yrohd0001_23980 [Yersinia rohdei ATCC 43380]|nr:hypothetical protein yrohd0001_23980 [Yersinia rohdei ATCC 43380]
MVYLVATFKNAGLLATLSHIDYWRYLNSLGSFYSRLPAT